MHLLKLVAQSDGRILGMVNWFPVHGTSMNNTNKLVSSDNKGLASLLFEQWLGGPGWLPNNSSTVAIFAQAHEGDVSPNTKGAVCIDTGKPCDPLTSSCEGRVRFNHFVMISWFVAPMCLTRNRISPPYHWTFRGSTCWNSSNECFVFKLSKINGRCDLSIGTGLSEQILL